ncbi:MAG: 2-C-methyl-D-erythritol 4-phosphate cytidylyltransferase [Acidimicrobiales bacterium]|nr:2-C-methyl-D-erythritol 4-phosphate cytidylyltransferase [Acidimicrobiales bacterium]
MSVWAIVVAGGSGARFGGPKQYAPLAGRRVLDWSLDAARAHADGVVLVVPAEALDQAEPGADVVVAGGATRSASVRAGLAAVPGDATVVVVHDAARPLASPALFATVIDAVRDGAAGALPGVPVIDTIRHRDGGVIDRDPLVRVQTPQAFSAELLRRAHAAEPEATDDAALVEALGARVVVVEGEPTNDKITDPADLATARAQLTGGRTMQMQMRIGQGFDVHRFSDDPDRPLVLGGVRFDGAAGLAGHSDADAIAHAVTDALLGAAGLGDIGQLFPDTDPDLAGADSMVLLAEAVRQVRAAGWRAGNVDCTVVLEAPKLAPRKAEIQDRLSAVVGAPVTVKGKRAEQLGSLGRREGIACFAVAILFEADHPGVDPAAP